MRSTWHAARRERRQLFRPLCCTRQRDRPIDPYTERYTALYRRIDLFRSA